MSENRASLRVGDLAVVLQVAHLPDDVRAHIERAEVDLALSDDALVALNDAAIAVVQERGPTDPLAENIERLVDALNTD